MPDDELQLGEWSIRFGQGEEQPVVYHRDSGELIATVHGSNFDESFQLAVLIAKAPTLRNAVKAAAEVFEAMAQYGNEREKATGLDMLPGMQAALHGLKLR
jgi:hypothetical protein